MKKASIQDTAQGMWDAVPEGTGMTAAGLMGAGLGARLAYRPKATMQEAGQMLSPSGDWRDLGVDPTALLAHRMAAGAKASWPEMLLGPAITGNPLAAAAALPRFSAGMARGEERAVQQLMQDRRTPEELLKARLQEANVKALPEGVPLSKAAQAYNMALASFVKTADPVSLALTAAGAPAMGVMALEDMYNESQRFDAMDRIEKDQSRKGMAQALSPYGVRAGISHPDFSLIMRERPSNPIARGLGLPIGVGVTGMGALGGAALGSLIPGVGTAVGGLMGTALGGAAGGHAINQYQAHLNQRILDRANQKGEEGWRPWNIDRLRPLVTGMGAPDPHA